MNLSKYFGTKTKDKFTKRDYVRLFFMGALLGAILFVLIYGVKILNPTYIGWIYYGDVDLKQHYIGWCNFRSTPWQFPVGLIESLSYPIKMSVIYTDSIPVVAVFFKLFSNVLPQDFQYFGLVGILSFALSGGTSVILLKRFIKNQWICLLTAPLFIVSFPVIQRMFYHTALAAHWMIFLAFIIWVYDDNSENVKKSMLMWAFMGFLCVSVHSYFLVILGMILLADRVTFLIANKGKVIKALLPIVTFSVAGLVFLWIYGGFYGESSTAIGEGLGTFVANYNTFINPIDYGSILPNLGVQNYFQYEGFGYLGFGVLVLSLIADVALIINRKSLKEFLLDNQEINNIENKAGNKADSMAYVLTGFGVLVLSFAVSTLPQISIGEKSIGQIPLPGMIFKIASIFRSNGRFIWTGMYILMLAIVVLVVKFLEDKKPVMITVIVLAIIIQVADLSGMIKQKHDYFTGDYEYTTMWDSDKSLNLVTYNKKSFVFLYTEGDLTMETAYYAYKHGMTINNFYFARNIDEQVTKEIEKYIDELKNGNIRYDTVYIMKNEDYDANEDYLNELGVHTVELDGFTVFEK